MRFASRYLLCFALFLNFACLPGCVSSLNLGRAIGAAGGLAKAAAVSDSELDAISVAFRRQQDMKNIVAQPQSPYVKRLNNIVRNYTSVNGVPLTYKVYITKEVNANAAYDGSVRVYSALMDLMTDDELRFVIGHEIGHVAHGHVKKKMQMSYVLSAARQAAGIYRQVGVFTDGMIGDFAQNFLNSQFSQSQELDADSYGLQLMKNNGYSTEAAISALSKLQGSGGFLSTHPSSEKRIKKIREAIGKHQLGDEIKK